MSQLNADALELAFAEGSHGLSARRLWEHTELGQVNVFGQTLSVRPELNDPEACIDVIEFDGEAFNLSGLTLAELRMGRLPGTSPLQAARLLEQVNSSAAARSFIVAVRRHLAHCARRQGLRNQEPPFLPAPGPDDVFGLPLLYSAMQRHLRNLHPAKANSTQWLKTLENLQKKGLRAEELELAELIPCLAAEDDKPVQWTAGQLAGLCDFSSLRISVIPVVRQAQQQLRFAQPDDRRLKPARELPKTVAALPRSLTRFDPALGYRIEKVEHQALWGAEQTWQAVTFAGQVIHDAHDHCGFQLEEAARLLANRHATLLYPKRFALGQFGSYAWSGGEDYREWLITLPYHQASYLSGHFNVRNVLAHVRCDVREGAEGERVLMLQEVQSDWAQRARRAERDGLPECDDETRPPFMKEWPALVLKLMLLHAAQRGLDALAWTRGTQQADRWNGLGAAGLITLYDRTLPREADRILKPMALACATMGVYVPTNFSIRQTENGYEVLAPDRALLGMATTLEDARAFVPDQGHELLFDVHAVRLTAATRKAINVTGFAAWGDGLRP